MGGVITYNARLSRNGGEVLCVWEYIQYKEADGLKINIKVRQISAYGVFYLIKPTPEFINKGVIVPKSAK